MLRRRFIQLVPAAWAATRNRAAAFIAMATAASGRTVSAQRRTSSDQVGSNDAEADWVQRSTGPGVLWAHDFRHDDEFRCFHRGAAKPYERSRTAPAPMPYHASLVATPFGASRAIKSAARGTHLVRDVAAASKDAVQTWYVADIDRIEDPWDGEYRLLVAAKEYVWVQSRNVADGSITVRRTSTRAYKALETTIGSGPQGRWIRPTACFAAGENGKPVPDQGLVNGSARKTRRWNQSDPRMHASFCEGYFGHRSYWDPAHGDAQYKDWTPRIGSRRETRVDAWEGDEFYLQFRAKISASRFDKRSPGAKMVYIQNCTTSGQAQLFWIVGPKSQFTEVPSNWPYGPHGRMFLANTAYGDRAAVFGATLTMPAGGDVTTPTKTWADGKKETIWLQDPESFPNARPPRNEGWHFPADKWVTYLVHIKPGRDSVIPYASSRLVRPAGELLYAEKPVEKLHLEDVSGFPDVEGAGNYPYYVHTAKSTNPIQHEHMRVIGIDRAAHTLTVERNAARDVVESVHSMKIGWDVGATIAYGPYKGFPGKPKNRVAWPIGVSRDRRLQYDETTVEIFVAVEGETKYTKILSYDKYPWMFGDMKYEYLNYEYNPPGLNSVELSQYLNDYVGSGSVAPPSGEHDIQYTQAILSREFIAVPLA
ncbi:MAG: hypothetical protein ROZ64_14820 [Burkholderiaceae bacterium]|jgi:hypothetical protein|nr:hypothetical protein [Burkholderiaceae bacterium]